MRGRPVKEFSSGASEYPRKSLSLDLNQQLFAASAMRSMVGNAALLASTARGRVGLLEVQAASNAMAGRARRAKVLVFKEGLR
ncbi:hypothetical protein D3C72_2354120 [compost metagenome]